MYVLSKCFLKRIRDIIDALRRLMNSVITTYTHINELDPRLCTSFEPTGAWGPSEESKLGVVRRRKEVGKTNNQVMHVDPDMGVDIVLKQLADSNQKRNKRHRTE